MSNRLLDSIERTFIAFDYIPECIKVIEDIKSIREAKEELRQYLIKKQAEKRRNDVK